MDVSEFRGGGTVSAPQVGDVVTTAEELDALPEGAALLAGEHVWSFSRVPEAMTGHRNPLHSQTGGAWTYTADFLAHHGSALVIYLPGQPPRTERVVKAEALREYAATWTDGHPTSRALRNLLHERADRIERGDA